MGYYVIEILFPNGNKITRSILAVSAWGAMNLAKRMYPLKATKFRIIGEHGA
jgi:hypothetical protein